MIKEENDLVIIAWSKLFIAQLLIKTIEDPGFQEAIAFNLDAARSLLERLIEGHRAEVFIDGSGI